MKFILAQDNTLRLKLPKLIKLLKSKCTSVQFAHLKPGYDAPDEYISCPATHHKYLKKLKPSLKEDEYILLLTEKQYDNNYFYEEESQLIIVSFFGWKYLTNLPAENGLVYFMCGILMDFVIPWDAVPHQERLGCVNDFLVDKTRVDDGMRKGHLCPACKDWLTKNPPDEKQKSIYDDVKQLLEVLSASSGKNINILDQPEETDDVLPELLGQPEPVSLEPVRSSAAVKMGTAVFISYSHKDEKYRMALEDHLKILQRLNMISVWSDRLIKPGDNLNTVIDENLRKSGIILLLVSASFIASDYCYGIELTTALEKDEKDEAVVIPIIVRDCLWQQSPVGKLKALPKDGKPIQNFSRKDEAYTSIAREICKIIQGN